MALSLTAIPDNFGSGGANIGDGTPKLVDILKEIRAALLTLETSIATVSAALTAHIG